MIHYPVQVATVLHACMHVRDITVCLWFFVFKFFLLVDCQTKPALQSPTLSTGCTEKRKCAFVNRRWFTVLYIERKTTYPRWSWHQAYIQMWSEMMTCCTWKWCEIEKQELRFNHDNLIRWCMHSGQSLYVIRSLTPSLTKTNDKGDTAVCTCIGWLIRYSTWNQRILRVRSQLSHDGVSL